MTVRLRTTTIEESSVPFAGGCAGDGAAARGASGPWGGFAAPGSVETAGGCAKAQLSDLTPEGGYARLAHTTHDTGHKGLMPGVKLTNSTRAGPAMIDNCQGLMPVSS